MDVKLEVMANQRHWKQLVAETKDCAHRHGLEEPISRPLHK